MAKSHWITMMTDQPDYDSLAAHLYDLKDRALTWQKPQASYFLNEEEQGAMAKRFPENALTKYDGGYPGARKKKVIFLSDEEDDFSDIQCIAADVDQRFRRITHRDVLGALMHLQIDRHSFGDFWVTEKQIYIYTSEPMTTFLIDHFFHVNQLNVSFQEIPEHPVQIFHQQKIETVIASERMDAIVAGLAHCSRSEAKKMIHQGLVQLNHVPLEEPDHLAYNNVTISIRGVGRFTYVGSLRTTRNGRIVAEFLQDI